MTCRQNKSQLFGTRESFSVEAHLVVHIGRSGGVEHLAEDLQRRFGVGRKRVDSRERAFPNMPSCDVMSDLLAEELEERHGSGANRIRLDGFGEDLFWLIKRGEWRCWDLERWCRAGGDL